MAYRKKDPSEKEAALLDEIAQKKAQLQAVRAQLSEQKRRDDTRMKIIAGGLALKHKDAHFEATLRKLINEYVVKPDERALFGLPPLNDPEAIGNDNAPAVPRE